MIPVIFDLDGTLVDSAPDIHAAVNAMLAAEGQPPLDLTRLISFVGNGIAVLVTRVMAHYALAPSEHARLTAATLAQMKAAPSRLSALYPGVRRALETLKANGHPLGLCTNKPQDAVPGVLSSLGLDGMFDVVVGGGQLPVLKPDPAPLVLTCRSLGQDHAIFVGDSEVDAETALRAQMPFLLFTQGYRHSAVEALPHHASFDHFDALPALIRAV